MENLPKSRKEARQQGLTKYFTGKPCKNGHADARYVTNKHCVTCCVYESEARRKTNPEVFREYSRKSHHKHKEKRNSYSKKWNKENREYHREWQSLDYKRNTSKYKAKSGARYRKAKLATPSWSNLNDIKVIYETCPEGYHVDHIVPLRGENVCGLHVPWNLQHLPAEENIRKSNKLLSD